MGRTKGAKPSPLPASCPPCLDCPRVSSRPPLHARRVLQGRLRGRALASTGAEGICQACRSRSIRRSQLVGRGAACSGQWAQRVGDQLVAEPDVWLQHRPQRKGRRTAVARTARNASHGRLTTGRSHLSRCPDRADDQRASDCFRRGTLSILTCVVLGSCLHIVGFRPAVCDIRRPLFILGSHTTL